MIKDGFFNSVNGDRTYNADDVSEYLGMLYEDGIANGLYAHTDSYASASSVVVVEPGIAIVSGKYVKTNEALNFTIPTNNTDSDRIDYIYAFCNFSTRTCGFGYSNGESAFTETSEIIYVKLYSLNISANSSSVQQDEILELNRVKLKVLTSENIIRETSGNFLSNFSSIDSTTFSGTFINERMSKNLTDGNGIFKVYVNGNIILNSMYSITAPASDRILVTINGDEIAYAFSNATMGQIIMVENIYKDIG